MISVKRFYLKLLSISLGLMFIAGYYWFFHYRLPWDWDAPGTGKLPQEIVDGFLSEAYDEGRGAEAVAGYFAPDVLDSAPQAPDRQNGAPMPHQIRSMVAQGQIVVVIHRVEPARGAPALDVIDVFETRRGRITRRDRYLTQFNDAVAAAN